MNSATELFSYELAIMTATEWSGGVLLGLLIAKRVHDANLERFLHGIEHDGHRHIDNINACRQDLGAFGLQTQTAAVEGIRSDFEQFIGIQPSPQLLDLYALDTAKRFTHLAVASYASLADNATLLGYETCAERLRTNLTEKEKSSALLDSVRPTIIQRIDTAEPSST